MVRSTFRCARAACIFLLLVLPSLSIAAEPGFGKISDGESLKGCGIIVGHKSGTCYILTAAHCLGADVRFDGYRTTILAKDTTMDIALLSVEGLSAPSSYPRVAPEGVNSGGGTRYGYPNSTYTEDSCSIDDDGGLSVKAIPGASGGPIVSSSGHVCGIITHTTHGVPAHRIRSFLASAGYSWLYKTDVARKPGHDASGESPDEFCRRIRKELARELQDHEEWRARFMAEQDRWYREHVKKMQQQRE